MDSLIHAILTGNKTAVMAAAKEHDLLTQGVIDAAKIQRALIPYKHLVSGYKFTIGWAALWTLIQSIMSGSHIFYQTTKDALKIVRAIKKHNEAAVAIKAALPQPIWEEIMENF